MLSKATTRFSSSFAKTKAANALFMYNTEWECLSIFCFEMYF